MIWSIFQLSIPLFFLLVKSVFTLPVGNEMLLFEYATKSYIYALPLVLFEEIKNSMNPVNIFHHIKNFPDPGTDIGKPSVDTLLSQAFLDLTDGPITLSVPSSSNRYYFIQILDAWTNIFFSIGKRTTGTLGRKFFIRGPDSSAMAPLNSTLIQSPTNIIWILGRVQVNRISSNDVRNVHSFQDSLLLHRDNVALRNLYSEISDGNYNDLQFKLNYTQINFNSDITKPFFKPPIVQRYRDTLNFVLEMDPYEFFRRFAISLVKNPPHKQDEPILKDLAKLGITRGSFDSSTLTMQNMFTIKSACNVAKLMISKASRIKTKSINGWEYSVEKRGTYGADYVSRAVISLTGLQVFLPQDVVYVYCDTSLSDKMPLTGVKRYTITFTKESIPPTRAFYSISVYDLDGQLIENRRNKYAIKSYSSQLRYNLDGSLTIYLQFDETEEELLPNWLPIPADRFTLVIRIYWPKIEVLNRLWIPPPVLLR